MNKLNKYGLRGSHWEMPVTVSTSLFVCWNLVLNIIGERSALVMEQRPDGSLRSISS